MNAIKPIFTQVTRRRLIVVAVTVCLLAAAIVVGRRFTVPPAISSLTVQALSDFSLDQENGTIDQVPHAIRRLDAQIITLIGRMWAGSQMQNELTDFDLTYHHSEQMPPLVQQFVACHSPTVVHYEGFGTDVRVTGTFHIRLEKRDGSLRRVFAIDVIRVEPAK